MIDLLRGLVQCNPLGVGVQPETLNRAGARVAEGAEQVWHKAKHALVSVVPTLQGKAASLAAGVTQPVRQLFNRCAATATDAAATGPAAPYVSKDDIAMQFSEALLTSPTLPKALKQCSESFIAGLSKASPEQLDGLIRKAVKASDRRQLLSELQRPEACVPTTDLHVQWSVLKLALSPLQTTVNRANAAVCRQVPKEAMQQALAPLSKERAEAAEAALHALAAAYQHAPETGTFNKTSVAVSCGLFQPESPDPQLAQDAQRASMNLLASWEVLYDV